MAHLNWTLFPLSMLKSMSMSMSELRCPCWRFPRNIHFAQWSEVWITSQITHNTHTSIHILDFGGYGWAGYGSPRLRRGDTAEPSLTSTSFSRENTNTNANHRSSTASTLVYFTFFYFRQVSTNGCCHQCRENVFSWRRGWSQRQHAVDWGQRTLRRLFLK